MTTRRDFLRGSAALVTGAVALEAYERLTWKRRFWSGWRFPRTYRVNSNDEFWAAQDEAWCGDTILIGDGVVLTRRRPLIPPRRGTGLLLICGESVHEQARRCMADEQRRYPHLGPIRIGVYGPVWEMGDHAWPIIG